MKRKPRKLTQAQVAEAVARFMGGGGRIAHLTDEVAPERKPFTMAALASPFDQPPGVDMRRGVGRVEWPR